MPYIGCSFAFSLLVDAFHSFTIWISFMCFTVFSTLWISPQERTYAFAFPEYHALMNGHVICGQPALWSVSKGMTWRRRYHSWHQLRGSGVRETSVCRRGDGPYPDMIKLVLHDLNRRQPDVRTICITVSGYVFYKPDPLYF